MSHDVIERSNNLGEPISLYEFTFGTADWKYSTDDEDTVLGETIYLATPITDSGVEQSEVARFV